jgi:DNA-directed RNA polymerase subunit RPC12/RpoP
MILNREVSMAQVNLNCPHCGGSFTLDHDRPLQTYWSCPYCGNRSLMQKSDGTIRLRGIISGQAFKAPDPYDTSAAPEPGPAFRHPDKPFSTGKAVWPPPPPVEEPPVHRSLSDYIAEVDEPDKTREPELKSGQRPQQEVRQDDKTKLSFIEMAETAARSRQLPTFNSYSRQAIDQKPDDRRMYAWRARLIEEADGFANKTWATPVWYLYTPRQKAALLAQHLYAFNTALRFSDSRDRDDLAGHLGKQLVRQAVEHLTERAELRCKKRLIGRTFKGQYHRSDLFEAKDFCDTVSRIDEKVSPLGCTLLKQAIRIEASALPGKLARRLTRF